MNGESIDINSIDPALKGIANNPLRIGRNEHALDSTGLATKKKKTKKGKEADSVKTED